MKSRSGCGAAFKEWAVVCQALAAGRQTIILRKGGIDEGRAGFRVQHREFWLYPTHFHMAAESLTPDAAEFIRQAAINPTASGQIPIQHLATIEEVHELATEDAALRLAGLHVWSEDTVRQRFHYRHPGLFLLLVRCYALPAPIDVPETGEMAGCKSWVALSTPLPTANLQTVLAEEAFASACLRLRSRL